MQTVQMILNRYLLPQTFLKLILLSLFIIASVLTPVVVNAANDAGKVLRITGRATITTQQGEIQQIKKGSKLAATDIISTSARSYVRMKMEDSSYIMVRPDSRMMIDEFQFNKKKPAENRSFMALLKGGFRAVSGLISDKRKYRFRTSVATIGIRGTEFSVRVCNGDCYEVDPVPANGLFMEVLDSQVIITTSTGDYTFTQGQYAYVANSNSPAVLLPGIPDVFDQSPIPPAEPDCSQ